MKLSLTRRPEALASTVEDLLEEVRRGHIRLPEFQRLFRWDAKDVLALFDSLARGFPLGTLLFWKRAGAGASAGRPLLTGQAPPPAAGSELLWVLDGQQRLTSLAATLTPHELPKDPRFSVVFDLDKDELRSLDARRGATARQIPLHTAFQTLSLLAWLDAHRANLSDADRQRAMALNRTMREYRIPAYVVVASDEETARLVFDRTNASGRRLERTEVFAALHAGLGAQEPASLPEIATALSDVGFGTLSQPDILHATVAVAGLDPTRVDHSLLSDSRLRSALVPTAAALRRTLVFLRDRADIPNTQLLPYRFAVTSLARFFHLHPKPRARSLELLARWVWRGAITARHRARESEYVRATLRAMTGADEEKEVQALLSLLPDRPVDFVPGPFHLRSAATRLAVLSLLALRPLDIATGELLDGAALVARRGARAFIPLVGSRPASDFTRVVQSAGTAASVIRALRGGSPPEVQRSLGLPAEAVAALSGGDLDAFAVLRRAWLLDHLRTFLDTRARWGASDRPSIASMRLEDSA